MRRLGILAAIALIASGLSAAVSGTPAQAAFEDPVPFCSAPHAPPCLTTFKHDGVDANPATYRVVWNEEAPSDGFYSVMVEKFNGSFWDTQMGSGEADHRFTIGFNFGSFDPRTAGGWGKPAPLTPSGNAVTWGGTSTSRTITLNLSPVDILHGCILTGDTWNCSTASGEPEVGQISFAINDATWFGETTAEHNLIRGFYNFRAAELGEAPPALVRDPATGLDTMVFSIQNVHESPSHVVYHGAQYLRLPNNMLKSIYGIPAPSTMTSSSLATTVSGGVGTVTTLQEDGDDAMIVNVTDVTFSKRIVRLKRGAVTPMRPANAKGVRASGTGGRVTYAKARARGAYPTGYVLRCVSGKQVRTRTGPASATVLRLGNLTPGRHYTCRVRATSRLGPGLWSFATTL